MAIIVHHVGLKSDFVLVGSGFGAYRSTQKLSILAGFLAEEQYGEFPAVLLCDAEGLLRWAKSTDVEVVSIDGRSPDELLAGEE